MRFPGMVIAPVRYSCCVKETSLAAGVKKQA